MIQLTLPPCRDKCPAHFFTDDSHRASTNWPRSLRTMAASLVLLVLAGCETEAFNPVPRDDSKPFLTVEKIKGSKIGALRKPFRMSSFGYTTDKLGQYRSGLSGKTIMARDRSNGTQIEYLAANGKSYLWYAGNSSVVVGSWTVKNNIVKTVFEADKYEEPELCFKYSRNTYDAVTRKAGGSWECDGLSEVAIFIDEMAPGDPFHLTSGKVPFRLDHEWTTLDALYAKKTGG